MPSPKKIGILIFHEEYRHYLTLCTECFEGHNWLTENRNWPIYEGDFGMFRQPCDYCHEEMNPEASPTMSELFTIRKLTITRYDSYTRTTRPKLPAPRTIERMVKNETIGDLNIPVVPSTQ